MVIFNEKRAVFIINHFIKKFKNQFVYSIQILRPDKMLEYVKFYKIIVTSWCYSSETLVPIFTNKMVLLRGNRLFKVARTLMSHMSIPNYFWNYVVLSVVIKSIELVTTS